jgi:hypothetical protein
MATIIKLLNRRLILIPLLAIVITVNLIVQGFAHDLTKSDWAAWVQAVGSVLAIFVAIWVSWDQAKTQRRREIEREDSELTGLLRALRTEISANAENARVAFGTDLEIVTENNPYLCTLPISEDPFDIYNGVVPKLGLIRDDALRDQIVRTYGSAKGFVLTLRYHNDLVAVFEQESISVEINSDAASRRRLQLATGAISSYSVVLRDNYRKMTEKVAVLPMLENIE